MSPRLRCFRLQDELFVELQSPQEVHSPELGLDLVVDGSHLRMRRPGDVGFLPTAEELARRADALAEKLRALGVDPDVP